MIKFILIFTLLNMTINTAQAYQKAPRFNDKNAVLSIIGEAENQQKYNKGMLAVACAIRNRGRLKGVYGLNAPRVRGHKYSANTYKKALEAWQQSANIDVCGFIGGADGWENVHAFGSPYWVKKAVLTASIGDHKFYIQNVKGGKK